MADATDTTNKRERRLAERDSYGIVLLLLILLYFLLSIGGNAGGLALKGVIAFGTLFLALYTSEARPAALIGVGVLAGLVIVAGVIEAFNDAEVLRGAIAAITAVISFFTALVIIKRIFSHKRIVISTVLGAVCVYVLFGLMYAFAYQSIDTLQPGTQFFTDVHDASEADFSYFSFVTLTTLGYGDVTAATNLGRSLAVTEAMVGQIFLVAVLGLVVGNLGRTRGEAADAGEVTPARSLRGRKK